MNRFALWPEPLDCDDCFSKAGFRCFADSDEKWDADFEVLVDRMFNALEERGLARLISGALPVRQVGLLRRDQKGSIRDGLICAATDDRFPPFQAAFGTPAQARVTTSDGHPIFWVELADPTTFEALLLTVAGNLPSTETKLSWEYLMPKPFAK